MQPSSLANNKKNFTNACRQYYIKSVSYQNATFWNPYIGAVQVRLTAWVLTRTLDWVTAPWGTNENRLHNIRSYNRKYFTWDIVHHSGYNEMHHNIVEHWFTYAGLHSQPRQSHLFWCITRSSSRGVAFPKKALQHSGCQQFVSLYRGKLPFLFVKSKTWRRQLMNAVRHSAVVSEPVIPQKHSPHYTRASCLSPAPSCPHRRHSHQARFLYPPLMPPCSHSGTDQLLW